MECGDSWKIVGDIEKDGKRKLFLKDDLEISDDFEFAIDVMASHASKVYCSGRRHR